MTWACSVRRTRSLPDQQGAQWRPARGDGRQDHTAPEISAMILGDQTTLSFGEPSPAVITVPAYFNTQRNATMIGRVGLK